MPWENDSYGLRTYNLVAVSNEDETIELANLARFANSPKHDELWAAAHAFAKAYAAALNAEEEN